MCRDARRDPRASGGCGADASFHQIGDPFSLWPCPVLAAGEDRVDKTRGGAVKPPCNQISLHRATIGWLPLVNIDTIDAAEVVEHYLCDMRPAATGEHCQ